VFSGSRTQKSDGSGKLLNSRRSKLFQKTKNHYAVPMKQNFQIHSATVVLAFCLTCSSCCQQPVCLPSPSQKGYKRAPSTLQKQNLRWTISKPTITMNGFPMGIHWAWEQQTRTHTNMGGMEAALRICLYCRVSKFGKLKRRAYQYLSPNLKPAS
jgi:hypothetical protein